MKETEEVSFAALASKVQEQFNIALSIRRLSTLGFFGGAEVAVLTFVLGAVASGFFKEAGTDLWKGLKTLTRLFAKEQEEDRGFLKVVLRLTYKQRELRIETTMPRGSVPSDIDRLIESFWARVPLQGQTITDRLDECADGGLPGDSIIYATFQTKDVWIFEERN